MWRPRRTRGWGGGTGGGLRTGSRADVRGTLTSSRGASLPVVFLQHLHGQIWLSLQCSMPRSSHGRSQHWAGHGLVGIPG